MQEEPAPAVDPQVQALAAALANLTKEQVQALAGLLGEESEAKLAHSQSITR